MSLATLFSVPKTPEQERAWSFSHLAHHRLLASAVFEKVGVLPPLYAIDPWGPQWDDLHQEMHNAVDAALDIQGLDLQNVDWENPSERAQWIWLNATLHQREQEAAGVNG